MKHSGTRTPLRLLAALLLGLALLLGALPLAALAQEDDGALDTTEVTDGQQDSPEETDAVEGNDDDDDPDDTDGIDVDEDDEPGDETTPGDGEAPGPGEDTENPTMAGAGGTVEIPTTLNGPLADGLDDEPVVLDYDLHPADAAAFAALLALLNQAPVDNAEALEPWLEANLPKWEAPLSEADMENEIPAAWGQQQFLHGASGMHYWRLIWLGDEHDGYIKVANFTQLREALNRPEDTINILITESFDVDGYTFAVKGGKTVHVTARDGNTAIRQPYSGEWGPYHFEVRENSTLVLSNLTLATTTSGTGGIYVCDGGSFIMQSGEISGSYGYGVFLEYSASFVMEGGVITGSRMYGVGVGTNYTPSGYGCTFHMKGGVISANQYVGVVVNANSAFTMEGGKIVDNTGAGVQSYGSETISITGGEISGNISDGTTNQGDGGGVSITGTEQVVIRDTVIKNNASNRIGYTDVVGGGGIYIKMHASGYLSTPTGSVIISGNTITGNTAVEEYTYDKRYFGSAGGILLDFDTDLQQVVLENNTITGNETVGFGGGLLINDKRGDTTIQLKNNTISGNSADFGGGVYVANGSVAMAGGAISQNKAQQGGGVKLSPELDTSPTHFTLQSGTISGNQAVSGAVSTGGGVHLQDNARFTMEDGAITGNYVSRENPSHFDYGGGGIRAMDNTILTITGGKITNNYNHGSGAGIRFDGGELYISNAEISGNTTTGGGGDTPANGGGVCVNLWNINPLDPHKVVIDNTQIINNNADYMGGGLAIYTDEGPEILVKNSTISDNTCIDGTYYLADGYKGGGGIAIESHPDANITLEGNTIAGNDAATEGLNGGGLFIDGPATLKGNTITGNTAVNGGGIYTEDYEDLTLTSGTFGGNQAADSFAFDEGDASTKAVYKAQVTQSGLSTLSAPFDVSNPLSDAAAGYAYNNLDINYTPTGDVLRVTTYQPDNGESSFAKATKVGNTLAQPAPVEKTGHSFIEWQKDDGTPWIHTGTGAMAMPNAHITLTAAWLANQYNLLYDLNTDGDNSVKISGGAITYDQPFAKPQNPADYQTYTFAGWYTARTGGAEWNFTTGTMPAYDLTLYAHWKVKDDPTPEPPPSSSSTPTTTPPSSEGGGNGGGGNTTTSATSNTSSSTSVLPSTSASTSAQSSTSLPVSSGAPSSEAVPASGTESGDGSAPNADVTGGGGNSAATGYTVNEDGSVTYVAPNGEEVTLADGTYTILESGVVIDHNPESPYYVQDNGTVDIFGNETPLGGLVSRGGWGLINLLLAIVAAASGLFQLVRGLAKHRLNTSVTGVLAMGFGIIPLLLFLILENKSQMLLVSRFTPLIAAVFVAHAVLLALSLRGAKRKKQAGEEA